MAVRTTRAGPGGENTSPRADLTPDAPRLAGVRSPGHRWLESGERALHTECRELREMDSRGRSQAPHASSSPQICAEEAPSSVCRRHDVQISQPRRPRQNQENCYVCGRQEAKRRMEASRGNRPERMNKDVSHGQKRERAASEHGRRDRTHTSPLDDTMGAGNSQQEHKEIHRMMTSNPGQV